MKIKFLVIAAMMLSLLCSINAFAEYTEGEYYQLGKYDDKPILWRCVSTDDDNGILMVSDKILCFKAANAGKNDKESIDGSKDVYGSNFWEESTIRQWLNSTADAGNIEWLNYPPDKEHIQTPYSVSGYNDGVTTYYNVNFYADEAGFLSQNNFTESELSVLKTVNQWQALPGDRLDLATNDVPFPYVTYYIKLKGYGDSEYGGGIDFSSPSEMQESYIGAMNRVSDTVFLLDPSQISSLYAVTGEFAAEAVAPPLPESSITENGIYSYWLRTPDNDVTNANYPSGSNVFQLMGKDGLGVAVSSGTEKGIRPAFYLNEATAQIKSGSGTEDDPYILDGKVQEDITVFSNGKQLEFNQAPVIENDRTLVGVRSVFESLGAEVEWDGAEKVVTASDEDTTIKLQIDNNIMQVNDEEVELDTPARLINDNTMVPLRAVSEALDAKVDWIEDLQRIVIDVQPEWVETDWNPDWYRRALRAYGYAE